MYCFGLGPCPAGRYLGVTVLTFALTLSDLFYWDERIIGVWLIVATAILALTTDATVSTFEQVLKPYMCGVSIVLSILIVAFAVFGVWKDTRSRVVGIHRVNGDALLF